jgi:4-amino-4-deoxy-L-arabinose transferase-like glycosyltransferase
VRGYATIHPVSEPSGTGVIDAIPPGRSSTRPSEERRFALAAVLASATIFGILLLAVPPLFISFDEAKYIGIGYNLLDGLGPRTPFGGYFLPHAPVWSAVLVLPKALFGIDPLDTGHVLNGLAGIGLIVLAGAIGWRIRPAVGGLAAAGTIAITYLHDLTRTARLDTPAAFLILAYLLVAFRAVRGGRVSWSIAAGAMFALAFEVKEIALPVFPVPFLAAALWGRPWRDLARVAGWAVVSAGVGLSWWFLLVARLANVVYRLGTPAWTLVPISLVVFGAAAACIVGPRLEDRQGIVRLARRLRLGTTEDGRIEPGRLVVVVVGVAAWCVGLLIVFARELGVRGTQIVDLRQIAEYAVTWLPGPLKLAAAVGAIGVGLSVGAWRTARGGERSAISDLWLATICAAPLVLLVIDVGEPPRNYLANLAILAALAGTGWLWLIEGMVARVSRAGRGVAGSGHGGRRTIAVVPALLLAAVVGAGGVLAVRALSFRETRSGQARADAIRTTVDWVRTNAPVGTKVAIGSLLSYEISLGLWGHNPTAQVRHVAAVGDPSAPEGVRVSGEPPENDWIAIDVAPRNVNQFQAYTAGRLTRGLRASGAAYWIYATETATSAPTIVSALPGAGGVREVAHWSWPTSTVPIGIHIYAIDPPALTFPADRLVVSPEALGRLVVELEAAGTAGRATATRLLAVVDVSPPSATTDGLLIRLRLVAGAGSG